LDKLGIQHFRIPHPSPLNRRLNDKAYEAEMLSGLHSFLDVHHSPSVI
jgi:uracil-DNA glycosylase